MNGYKNSSERGINVPWRFVISIVRVVIAVAAQFSWAAVCGGRSENGG
jgi:hypothetical protein